MQPTLYLSSSPRTYPALRGLRARHHLPREKKSWKGGANVGERSGEMESGWRIRTPLPCIVALPCIPSTTYRSCTRVTRDTPHEKFPFPPRTVAGSAALNNFFRPTYPAPRHGPRQGRLPQVLRAEGASRHATPASCAWGRLAERRFVWRENKIDSRPTGHARPHRPRICTPDYPVALAPRRRRRTRRGRVLESRPRADLHS